MKSGLFPQILALIFTWLVGSHSQLSAQYLFGQITDQSEVPLEGAILARSGTVVGASTNELGEFALPIPDTALLPFTVVVTYAGIKDSFTVDAMDVFWSFSLPVKVTLQEVEIKDAATGAYISVLQPIKTEIINRAELRKAACCDLAGCFETQSTVQPTTTNILTNAKELRILGLSGVYNQVLVDGMPTLQGLTYTYGLSTIPGNQVENIWVVKGANSVVQGFEGMVGQITVFPRDGQSAEKGTADVLINSFGEKHLNASISLKKEKWNNYLAVHSLQPGSKWDRDQDGFLDLPLLTRYAVFNKWKYRSESEKGLSGFIGLRFVQEERIGGQSTFNEKEGKDYGQVVRFKQPEWYGKVNFRLDSNQILTFFSSAVLHRQSSQFGWVRYTADQNQLYSNVQYARFWGKNTAHEFKTGLSFRHLNVGEHIEFDVKDSLQRSYQGHYLRTENTPGIFAENTFNWDKGRWTWIVGVRTDRHNLFGQFTTPRTLLRFNPAPEWDFRFSSGYGWRSVQLFPENIGLLTGNRDIRWEEALRPEEAWNSGLNLTHRTSIGRNQVTFTADFYHTRFLNQFFPDYDRHPAFAFLYNFSGKSVSNGLQLEVAANRKDRLEARLAYNFVDVYRIQEDQKVVLPFNAKHRLLGAATYRTPEKDWQFDLNVHWYGQQRLPNTEQNPIDLRRPAQSDPYTMVNLQIRRAFKWLDCFVGVENVFDFRQKQPILGWQRPFAAGFDPSFAWGPTRGRELYIGINFRLP
jgi:outer membrane receptor for ferrienterochelin and colicins